MLPRPHLVQAEEKTLVTGPRQLEGIQEVFLVVMRPKKIPSIQVKGYLETAHVYKKEETRMPSPKPNEVTFHLDPNTPDAKVLPKEPFGIHWEVHAYGDVSLDIIEQGESLDATPYQKEFIFPQEPEGTVIALDYKREGVHKGHEYVRGS